MKEYYYDLRRVKPLDYKGSDGTWSGRREHGQWIPQLHEPMRVKDLIEALLKAPPDAPIFTKSRGRMNYYTPAIVVKPLKKRPGCVFIT